MESARRFRYKYLQFKDAIANFKQAMAINLKEQQDLTVIDSIRNGQIQKFEFCLELTWKLIKLYLQAYHALDVYSPKQVLKTFFTTKTISKDLYENLYAALEARNRMSHLYNEELFEEIYKELPQYLEAFLDLDEFFKTI